MRFLISFETQPILTISQQYRKPFLMNCTPNNPCQAYCFNIAAGQPKSQKAVRNASKPIEQICNNIESMAKLISVQSDSFRHQTGIA